MAEQTNYYSAQYSPVNNVYPNHLLNYDVFELLCSSIVSSMSNKYDGGYFVIDNFIGNNIASNMLEEVESLKQKGLFSRGGVFSYSSNHVHIDHSIRNDLIMWIEQGNPLAPFISSYLVAVDHLISTCISLDMKTIMNDSSVELLNPLKDINLSSRTKAMVTCYPSGSSGYIYHIDNTHDDGRLLTCIFYLNRSWIPENGGELYLYPTSGKVIQVPPLFDRLVLCWSDERMPHEVKATNSDRFAVTLWYYNVNKRNMFINKS